VDLAWAGSSLASVSVASLAGSSLEPDYEPRATSHKPPDRCCRATQSSSCSDVSVCLMYDICTSHASVIMQHVLRIVMGYELAQRLVPDSNGGQRRQGNLPIPFRFFLFFAGIRHRLRVSITASGRRA